MIQILQELPTVEWLVVHGDSFQFLYDLQFSNVELTNLTHLEFGQRRQPRNDVSLVMQAFNKMPRLRYLSWKIFYFNWMKFWFLTFLHNLSTGRFSVDVVPDICGFYNISLT